MGRRMVDFGVLIFDFGFRGKTSLAADGADGGDLVAGGDQLVAHIQFSIFSILRLRAAGLSYAVPIYIRTVRSVIFPPGAKIFEDFSLSTVKDKKGYSDFLILALCIIGRGCQMLRACQLAGGAGFWNAGVVECCAKGW